MRVLLPALLTPILATAYLCAAASYLRAQAAPEPTRILMLFTHDPNAPGVAAFASQLRNVVNGGVPARVVFYDELLDLDRFPQPERSPELARYLAEKYDELGFDAIVAEGSSALRFAAEHLTLLFPDVPIVYGLAFEPVVDFSALPANVTGRRQPLPFAFTLAMARSLQPDAEQVVLVGGAAALDSVVLSAALEEVTPMLGELELVVLQDWTYESLLANIRRLPPRTFVVLSSFRRDQRGVEFNSGDLIASLTRVASVPVYGIARNWVGEGVVGGSVMNFGDDGLRTGELLLRVLRRGPGDPLPPPEVAATPLVVDWRQLERWGLSARRLPSGTEILFRTPTLWERYRGVILAVMALFAAQSALIALLLLERRRRIRAQRTLEEQAAYERLIAVLTTDAVRHTPDEAVRTLEDELERMGRFAGARSASLVVSGDAPERPPVRRTWSAAEEGDPEGGALLRIPLIVGEKTFGVLELHRAGKRPWPKSLVTRLEAAGDLIAGALARAHAARALEQSAGQIAHIARVATLGELTAAVSHELRQPLTAIRANAEAGSLLLAQAPPDVDESQAIFEEIVRDSGRASDLMEHIRMLLRRQDPTLVPLDVNRVCVHTVRLLDSEAESRGVLLRLALEPLLPTVTGDPVQLQQVVMNLALNALDASAGSGGSREVVVGTAVRAGRVEIFVRDNGPGLSGNERRLFEPFFSTKPQGLGMGLSIVRAIVERHRGIVSARDDPGGGAIFRVTLPTADIESEVPTTWRPEPTEGSSFEQGPGDPAGRR